jgi:hypothetical protein
MTSTINASTTAGLVQTADTSGVLALQTAGTAAVTVDASQNVGIGTASPATYGKLVSLGTDNATLFSAVGATNMLRVQGYNSTYVGTVLEAVNLAQSANTPMFINGSTLKFGINGATQATIDSSGNLFVNATAQPLASNVKAYVNGPLTSTALLVGNGAAGSASGFFNADCFLIQNEAASTYRSYSCGTAGNSAYGTWVHYTAKSAGTPVQIFSASNGAFAISGALSKGSGSFRIDHPLPQLEATHQLVHSFIEGPQADLIYRGKVNLLNGSATVNIDTASTMTEGTFVALCRNVQCFTTNESDWTAVKGSVSGNILTIEAEDNTSTASISWMVIGERQDKHMIDTGWTDENGKVIVEPLKPPINEPQLQADVAALKGATP